MPYTLLPEWSPQESILITWPTPEGDWSEIYEDIQKTYTNIVKTVAATQKIIVVSSSPEHTISIKEQLSNDTNISNVLFREQKTNDTWIRDYGPISAVHENKLTLLNFQFNGYGKYPFELDNQLSTKLFPTEKITNIDFILEGGSLEVTNNYIITNHCQLSRSRTQKTKEDILDYMSSLFSQKVIWLENGNLIGDDTDGHIDNLLRFIGDDTLFYLTCSKSNEHYQTLKLLEEEIHDIFKNESKISLSLPDPKKFNGKPLPMSYLNFLITNEQIILPIFDDALDDVTVKTLEGHSMGRRISPIDSRLLTSQGGGIHCSTMQVAKYI